MSYVLSLRVFLPRATPLPSLSAAAVRTPRHTPYAADALPTPHVHYRGRSPATRRFALLSFTAAAVVAGDNGRRLSAELWVGTSMYIRMYTTTHSGVAEGSVCGVALTAARRAASTYLVVVDI